jgi:hypothetical protein
MLKVPVFLDEVEDEAALYLDLEEQVLLVQAEEGIQRSEEPAAKKRDQSFNPRALGLKYALSKSIKNDCAGVPTEILPAHSSSESSSVSFSDWRLTARCCMRASTSMGIFARGLISAP